MIDIFVIASIPFIIAGSIFTFIQLKRSTYRVAVTKYLLLALAACALCSIPMSCMIWENGFCEALPFQMELFFIGYVGVSFFLIAAPTLGGWLIGQGIAALLYRIKVRFGD